MPIDISNLEVVEELGNTHVKAGKGSRVRCISVDEFQSRWGNNDSAEEYLTIGEIYTLSREPEVHSWHTKYYLEEVPGKKFNSVQFEAVDEGEVIA